MIVSDEGPGHPPDRTVVEIDDHVAAPRQGRRRRSRGASRETLKRSEVARSGGYAIGAPEKRSLIVYDH